MRVHLVILCAIFVYGAKSQNQNKADSIKNLIVNQELKANQKLEAYYWLSVYSSSPEEGLKYGNFLLGKANKLENSEYIIKANLRIGVAHRMLGNLARAQEYFFKCADLASGKGQFQLLLADTYQEISACYTQNGDAENALLYGSKTIDILKSLGNKQRLGLTLLNTGYDYYLMERYDSAMAYYNESEPILTEIGMTIGLAYIIGNRALVYWKKGDTERAKQDLFIAIGMLEPLGDRYGMADYHNQLGNIFLEENDLGKAITNLTKGLDLAVEDGYKEQIRDASHLLFLLYQLTGDDSKAIDYQTQYYAYKNSLQNLETTQRLANLRTRFEVGQKQAEVDLLLEQKRNSQIIMAIGGIILVIVLGLVIIIYLYSKSKSTLNIQLEEQKEDLINVNKTKDKFFSIISHDLRGPVSNLSGLVSVTKYLLDDKKNEPLIVS